MKSSFIVQLATKLLVAQLGVGGPLGALAAFLISRILGELLDRGIIVADIQIDKLKEAMKDPQWEKAAREAYEHATAKVYSEQEKDAIRKEYLAALSKYATYGNGLPNS